jgi:hypothetical protein
MKEQHNFDHIPNQELREIAKQREREYLERVKSMRKKFGLDK